MILFLHGPDTYRSRQRLSTLIEAFQKKYDPKGQGLVRLDGETLSVEEFRKAVATSGLFSSRRCIVVEGLLGRNKKSSVADGILDAIRSGLVPDDYVLLFWEAELPKKAGKLQAVLVKEKAEQYPLLDDQELRRWIGAEAKRLKAQIDRVAGDRLASLVGPDLWRAASELQKLSAYADGRTIEVADVDQLVELPVESRVFAFTDALGTRNARAALRELRHLLLDGVHPLALVQILGRHLTLLRRVQLAAQDTKHPATVAKRLKIHPFVAQKSLAQSQKFTESELADRLAALLELDRKLKSSRLEPEALLEGFVLMVTR